MPTGLKYEGKGIIKLVKCKHWRLLGLKQRYAASAFLKAYENLAEVLTDHKLAALGDSYVNFAFSLSASIRKRKPSGVKVKGSLLAEALRKAGLREYLPSRMTKHMLADAAEALIVYGWLSNCITLEESVSLMGKTEDPVEGLSSLLLTIKNRITLP